MIRELLSRLVDGGDISMSQAESLMGAIMDGALTPSQVGALLIALRMKGETPEEIAGLARAMRDRALKIAPRVDGRIIDLCGTGGAPFKTFNVSTIASFVVAGAGVPVAKHGNRSFTSTCGSADLLEALGVPLSMSASASQTLLEKVGIAFLFAPNFHPGMRGVTPVRKELGVRTVFNVLGPLTNPAGARGHLMGVFHPDLVRKLPRVMNHLGLEHGMVVHGEVGSDEISTLGRTSVGEVVGGEISFSVIDAQELGFVKPRPDDIGNLSPKDSAEVAIDILGGKVGPRTDIVLLNAAAGLKVGGKVADIGEGVEMARESLDSGKAAAKLEALKRFQRS